MSAFVVDEKHVKQLAIAWATWSRYSKNTSEEATETAREFMRENIRSVAHRYNEPEGSRELPGPIPIPEADLIEVSNLDMRYGCRLEPVAVFKMCDCLEYQSCETSDYRQSKAFALLEHVRALAVTRLPGYDEAPWDYSGASA